MSVLALSLLINQYHLGGIQTNPNMVATTHDYSREYICKDLLKGNKVLAGRNGVVVAFSDYDGGDVIMCSIYDADKTWYIGAAYLRDGSQYAGFPRLYRKDIKLRGRTQKPKPLDVVKIVSCVAMSGASADYMWITEGVRKGDFFVRTSSWLMHSIVIVEQKKAGKYEVHSVNGHSLRLMRGER